LVSSHPTLAPKKEAARKSIVRRSAFTGTFSASTTGARMREVPSSGGAAEDLSDSLAGKESKERQSRKAATTDTPRANRHALKIREPPHDLVL
jgi:hypothetical protein